MIPRLAWGAVTAFAGGSNVALLACDLIRYAQGETFALLIAASNGAIAAACFWALWVTTRGTLHIDVTLGATEVPRVKQEPNGLGDELASRKP